MNAIQIENSALGGAGCDFLSSILNRTFRLATQRAVENSNQMPQSDGASQELAAIEARVIAGEEGAVGQFIDAISRTITWRVSSCVVDRESTRVAVESILRHVLSGLARRPARLSLETWIARVTSAECLQVARNEGASRVCLSDLTLAEERVVETSRRAEQPLSPAAFELVAKLARTLSPRARLLVHFLIFEGRTPAEVSRLTGWNRFRVDFEAFFALRKLRGALDWILVEKGIS